jgi:hypothetical protein
MKPASRNRSEITDHQIDRFTKKYPQLKREDFKFTQCADHELRACWLYEYTRVSPRVIQIVTEWRMRADSTHSAPKISPEPIPVVTQSKTIDKAVLDSLILPTGDDQVGRSSWITEPGTFDYHLQIANLGLYDACSFGRCFPALCPEWPNEPYLNLPPAERERRLKLLCLDSTETLAAELTPQPPSIEDGIREFLSQEIKVENVRLHIDKRKSHRELLRQFAEWLKIHHPGKAKPNVSSRSLHADLKALGAYRIQQVTSWDDPRSPQLYSEQSEWVKANTRAKNIIARIESVETVFQLLALR